MNNSEDEETCHLRHSQIVTITLGICCWYESLIFVVSEGTDRDLRTKFKGIRDLGVIAKFSVKPMIWNCLSQLYAKDITTPDDKQELDEALQQEVDVRKDLIRNFANTIDLDQLDI
ncbi:Phosphoenolpyruvate carboxylase [Arachis hypogaea]|nr:Phosphoenolpyruvate carboxylase [Arachis hypogaea]